MLKKIKKKIYKNIIQPYKMIKDFKKGLIPKVKINIGTSDNKIVKNWYEYLNKKDRIFSGFSSMVIGVALIDVQNYCEFSEFEKFIKKKKNVFRQYLRCQEKGYTFRELNRKIYADAIFEINISADQRQGKKMAKHYLNKPYDYKKEDLTEYFGLFNKEGKLVSYIHLLYMNEVVFITKLLGHDSFQKDFIMYLMIMKSIEHVFQQRARKMPAIKYIVYDSFLTNSEGLAFFKTRFGFSPYAINWLLD